MHLNTLAPATKQLLEKISKKSWLKDFYLAGGTAFALQYGHRQSIDLDFFTKKNINTKTLLSKIKKIGKFKLLNEENNTIEGYLDGVRLSFMTYPYAMIDKRIKFFDSIYLASPLDIALMKISAISGRNTRKDFVDLYLYMKEKKIDLSSLFDKMKKKFDGIDYDVAHICKSLIYFKEADKQPMPRMLQDISWDKVKTFFVREVKNFIGR